MVDPENEAVHVSAAQGSKGYKATTQHGLVSSEEECERTYAAALQAGVSLPRPHDIFTPG